MSKPSTTPSHLDLINLFKAVPSPAPFHVSAIPGGIEFWNIGKYSIFLTPMLAEELISVSPHLKEGCVLQHLGKCWEPIPTSMLAREASIDISQISPFEKKPLPDLSRLVQHFKQALSEPGAELQVEIEARILTVEQSEGGITRIRAGCIFSKERSEEFSRHIDKSFWTFFDT